ncbi:MAG: hypothetical protein L0Z70_04755 [Chloroflexi bacterium]|nr:hypothetical protein [Chloroflexota bacterium]
MSEKKRTYPLETSREKPLKLQRFPEEERSETRPQGRVKRTPERPPRQVVERLIDLFKDL